MAGLLRYRQQRENTYSSSQNNSLRPQILSRWNSCGGQDTSFLKMCSPPSWKDSEGEDLGGDYSVWSSNKEDNEESDWTPDVECKSSFYVLIWSILYHHTFSHDTLFSMVMMMKEVGVATAKDVVLE